MIGEAEVVVIGAGSFGPSITYHLAKRGKKVILVDKLALVSQTAPRAAGLTAKATTDPQLNYLARRSVDLITTFEEDTGEQLQFHQSGSIVLTRAENEVDRIYERVRYSEQTGGDTQLISPVEAEKLAPYLKAGSAHAIAYTPSDLYLEAGELPLAYTRAAEKLGATLMPHTEVLGFELSGDSITQVVTKAGRIPTQVVVDAAGAWTASIAQTAGVHVPMIPTRHQLYITEPIEGVTHEQPIVRITDAHVYIRPDRGGLLLGGYEPKPLQVDMSHLSDDFSMDKLPLDFRPLEALTQNIANEIPALSNTGIDELRGGLPTMTADGRFIIDEVPGIDSFFLASGCCVGGLSNSPAVGEVLAEWIVNGAAPLDMSSFSLARFGPELENEELLREACLAVYANKYTR
jgi:glycine/D-amino acid oxidase-like deaminating enzyme